MKTTKRSVIIIIFLILIIPASLMAEYVFLKDGSIVKCKIENETAASITVRLPDGKEKNINPKDVMRILFTELYMGKIFVNKTDGTVIEAYMVDEDQTTYTFRKDLYKPQEFILKRDEVLFTTRKNPSGLTGVSEIDEIKINWKPPYSPVKLYKIYFKGTDEYKIYGETLSTEFTLKKLKSNTLYSIKVTAIDNDGYESLPSNEVKVMTKNILPDPPSRLRCVRIEDSQNAQMTASLSWQAGADPDGKVKGYNIYKKDKKDYSPAGTSNTASFDVKGLNPDLNYYFVVRTVDDKNSESKDSKEVNTLDLKGYDITIEPLYIFPIGKFKDIHKNGYGVLVSGTMKNVFMDYLNFGAALGFFYFTGATSDVKTSYMIPLLLQADYRWEIFDYFFIVPKISVGMSYNYISYEVEPELYTGYGLDKEGKSKWAIEPLALAGLTFMYEFADFYYVSAGANYGLIYEKSGMLSFITAEVGAGRKF